MAWNPLEYYEGYTLRKSFIRPCLYDLLPCDYAFCGAYAMKEYISERSTYGFDVYVDYSDLQQAHASLLPYVLRHASFADTHYYYVLQRGHVHLNLIALSEEWAIDALTSAQKTLDLQTAEPKLPFHWLVLSKMSHGKRQDYMDCARLISRASKEQILATQRIFDLWFPEGLQPLRELYKVGKQELKYAPQDKAAYQSQINELSDWYQLATVYSSYQQISWEVTLKDPLHISFPIDWESVTDL